MLLFLSLSYRVWPCLFVAMLRNQLPKLRPRNLLRWFSLRLTSILVTKGIAALERSEDHSVCKSIISYSLLVNILLTQLTPEHVDHFKSIVGDSGIIYDNEDDLFIYNTDWMNKYRGK